jgi:hypothetical protein
MLLGLQGLGESPRVVGADCLTALGGNHGRRHLESPRRGWCGLFGPLGGLGHYATWRNVMTDVVGLPARRSVLPAVSVSRPSPTRDPGRQSGQPFCTRTNSQTPTTPSETQLEKPPPHPDRQRKHPQSPHESKHTHAIERRAATAHEVEQTQTLYGSYARGHASATANTGPEPSATHYGGPASPLRPSPHHAMGRSAFLKAGRQTVCTNHSRRLPEIGPTVPSYPTLRGHFQPVL